MFKKMYMRTSYSKQEVLDILNEQVDPFPGLLRCIITLNACRYSGTSNVCGIIRNNAFELRNRKDPYLSLRAKGEFVEGQKETVLKIDWVKPKFSFLKSILSSYDLDREIIIHFMKNWLKAKRIEGEF